MKPTSVALFVGTFGALVGVIIAFLALINSTIFYTNNTNSFFAGLLYGVGVGIFALLLVPAFYFAVGWILGWLDGIILNAVLRTSGGIEMGVTDDVVGEEPGMAANRKAQPTFGETVDRRDIR